MNVSNLETFFMEAMQGQLSTDLPILRETDDTGIPTQQSYILVGISKCDNVVGNLWKVTASVAVVSPAPSVSPEDHSDAVSEVAGILNDPAFYSALNATSGGIYGGHKIMDTQSSPSEMHYRHTTTILIGIVSS
jgi:hypothetical protein